MNDLSSLFISQVGRMKFCIIQQVSLVCENKSSLKSPSALCLNTFDLSITCEGLLVEAVGSTVDHCPQPVSTFKVLISVQFALTHVPSKRLVFLP